MKNNQLFRRISILAKPHIRTILIVTLSSIIINCIEILKPYLIKIAIDDYLTKNIYIKGTITIGMIGIAYIICVVVGNILDFSTSTATNMMGEKILYTLRNKLYNFVENSNIPFHDKVPSGKLYSRIINDVEDISTMFKDVITTIFKDIVLVIAIIIIMFRINAKLCLLALTILPLVIVISYFITKKINKLYEYSKTARTNMNTFFADSIYGIKLIKIFNRQREKQKECEENTKKFRNSRIIPAFYEGLLPAVIEILQHLSISIIIWTCTYNWFNINLEIGVIYVFITYIKQLFEPISRIIDDLEVVQEAVVSINKIFDILDKTEYLEDFRSGIKLEKIEGKIEFKNVWFKYKKDEDYTLKNFNLSIDTNKKIAIVGRSGNGKSTLFNLLLRYFDVTKGSITIDGVNIKDLSEEDLRKNISIIRQSPFLFNMSIFDNFKLVRDDITLDEVRDACKKSYIDEYIMSLPKGYDTIIGEGGVNLSGGQKQRIAIARTLILDTKIILFDEATSALDNESQEYIKMTIDNLIYDHTIIIVAHRLSTIVDADIIHVVNEGQLESSGTHKELLNKSKVYQRLYANEKKEI